MQLYLLRVRVIEELDVQYHRQLVLWQPLEDLLLKVRDLVFVLRKFKLPAIFPFEVLVKKQVIFFRLDLEGLVRIAHYAHKLVFLNLTDLKLVLVVAEAKFAQHLLRQK